GTSDPVRMFAISVMPGPQLLSAVAASKLLKARFPRIPITWGGYFPTLYPKPVLDTPYVDWVVRGQGERTFNELLEVLDGQRDPQGVAGLAYRDEAGYRINSDRPWVGPDEFPRPPYDHIDVADYLGPTSLGRRSGVYQASIGCPYRCSFCGVISVYGKRERFEDPKSVATNLSYLKKRYGMDSVHFYDNNFFLKEAHAEELCERMTPLDLGWWCETRIDRMLTFSDATWKKIEASGARMIFFGAESGSDTALRAMSKNLTTAETYEIAHRMTHTKIIPEYSFVLGGPDDPEDEIDSTLDMIRKLKGIDPRCEIVFHYYTPMPQRSRQDAENGASDGTPQSIEEWCEPAWVDWMTFEKPRTPWMNRRLWKRVEDFQLILESRYPSVRDPHSGGLGRGLVERVARRRWDKGNFKSPSLLRAARKLARLMPENRQAYGHLRPPDAAIAPVQTDRSKAERYLPFREGYRLWAPTYDAQNGLTELDELAVKQLSPPRFDRLLDAGCGTGFRLPSQRSGVSVGVDIVPEMLTVGRARGETRLVQADIRTLPYPDEIFDLLWCRLALSHLVDAGTAYRELWRTAAPGAELIVTDLHAEAGQTGFNTSFKDPSGKTQFIEVHLRNADEHTRLAADAGFEIEETLQGVIGPEIRHFYEEAGELSRYERQQGQQVLLALKFVKRSPIGGNNE
ncbi:methyltransferase domain-containing protein, partial [bacterium]|nr:methyltransferase domain-containing protein [bacterium]